MRRKFRAVTVCTDGKCGKCLSCALERKSNAHVAVQSITNAYYKNWRDVLARCKDAEAAIMLAAARERHLKVVLVFGMFSLLLVAVVLLVRLAAR